LLKTHNAVVLLSLRYEETVYESATKKKLLELEPLHNTCVRISIEAHCTTRVSEILKEAGIRSLAEIWKMAVAVNGIRIREKTAHPLGGCPNADLRVLMFEVRVENNLCSYGLQDNIIYWSLALWQHLNDKILDTEMLQFSKKKRYHHYAKTSNNRWSNMTTWCQPTRLGPRQKKASAAVRSYGLRR
jgi:hypothetical protein